MHLQHLGCPVFVSCLSTEMPNLCTTVHTFGKPTMTPALNSASRKGWAKVRGRVCCQRGGRGTCCLESIAKIFNLLFQGWLLRFNCLLSLVWICIFYSLLTGKTDWRPSSNCGWSKEFQSGFPPPPSFPGRPQSGSNSQAPLPTPTKFYRA